MKRYLSELRVPVISDPMAGGLNNPKMAAAVVQAGGVGSFGFAYSTPEKIESDLHTTQNLLNGSVAALNANFFVFKSIHAPDSQIMEAARESLSQLGFVPQSDIQIPKAPFFPELDAQIEPIWRVKPRILTFHFGIPEIHIVEKAKELGIFVGITATSIVEAKKIQAAGADFIVAQGVEAGGHRGVFDTDVLDEKLVAQELLLALKKEVNIPIVIAGGVMTAMDVKKMIHLGADAVQMGSAFLTTHESTASTAHKRYLLNFPERGSVYTKVFSGRLAQGIRNNFIEQMAGKAILPFPVQNTMTGVIRQKAVQLDDGEYQSLWCGSNYQKCQNISIEELMQSIHLELQK